MYSGFHSLERPLDTSTSSGLPPVWPQCRYIPFANRCLCSWLGLGAVLKQNGHPVAYASCALTSPEICCHSKRMSRNNVCPKPILTLSIGWPFQNLDRSCTLPAFLRTANIHAPATSPKLLCLPSLPALLVLEISLLNKNVTCCPHMVWGCIKLKSKQTYGIHTTDIYIIIISIWKIDCSTH